MEWSKGVMRLMATLRWDGTWTAELGRRAGVSSADTGRRDGRRDGPDDAVCALADDVEDLVVAADDEGGHAVVHGGLGIAAMGHGRGAHGAGEGGGEGRGRRIIETETETCRRDETSRADAGPPWLPYWAAA